MGVALGFVIVTWVNDCGQPPSSQVIAARHTAERVTVPLEEILPMNPASQTFSEPIGVTNPLPLPQAVIVAALMKTPAVAIMVLQLTRVVVQFVTVPEKTTTGKPKGTR